MGRWRGVLAGLGEGLCPASLRRAAPHALTRLSPRSSWTSSWCGTGPPTWLTTGRPPPSTCGSTPARPSRSWRSKCGGRAGAAGAGMQRAPEPEPPCRERRGRCRGSSQRCPNWRSGEGTRSALPVVKPARRAGREGTVSRARYRHPATNLLVKTAPKHVAV